MKYVYTIFLFPVLFLSQAYGNELREISVECKKNICALKTQFLTAKNLPGYYFTVENSELNLNLEKVPSKVKFGTYKLSKESQLIVSEKEIEGQSAIQISLRGPLVKKIKIDESLVSNVFKLSWQNSANLSKKIISNLKVESPKVSKSTKTTTVDVVKGQTVAEPLAKVELEKKSVVQKEELKKADLQKEETSKAEIIKDEKGLQQFVNSIPKEDLDLNKLFVLKPSKMEKVVLTESKLFDPKTKAFVKLIMPGTVVDQLERYQSKTLVIYKSKRYLISSAALKNYSSLTEKENEKLKSLALSLVEKKKSPLENGIPSEEKLDANNKDSKDTKVLKSKIKVDTKTYKYSSFGRKDPFVPFVENIEQGMNIDAVQIVGIIWENQNPIAILEEVNGSGASYTLKENDPIQNGKVFKITPSEVIFELTEFGMTRRFAMQLPKLEDESKK